ncbi:hypothetical protein [Janthinobacterium sp. EB271-G4-7A]|uniref:hypothetical protein n=1 Tax=Janthinobacterium sp. EB271-G4-7A TaxID=2775056 RepID=UPI001E469C6E|nr:hypothetical protein [Janthinobacterium sp. EB271-G4-7A]MCC7697456.1 hypothetical protein [Janthinobacterium sp. EB271-G4-7A]
MKRMNRDPIKFGAIEYFSNVARQTGYQLNNPSDIAKFSDQMLSSLKKSQESMTMLYGKRTEAMFAYVAGGLDNCRMIKSEDAGEVFIQGLPVQAPDYRLILKDGTKMLVEVKNFRSRKGEPFLLAAEYYKKIELYAEMNDIDLKIAIYFSDFKRWCLLSPKSFKRVKKGLEISFTSALAKNEMSILGDAYISTLPSLRLELMTAPEEANTLDGDGKAIIIFRSSKIYCAGTELHAEIDQRIAFYLMRFGNWPQRAEAVVLDGKLHGVVFSCTTDELFEGQPFGLIGELSGMISWAFAEHTIQDGQVIALDVTYDPDTFSPKIPREHKSDQLPLWQFIVQPNYEFVDVPNCNMVR